MKYRFRGSGMLREWGVTDEDYLFIKDREYPLSEIKGISNLPPTMPLTNGVMNITVKDGKTYTLAYSRGQRDLAAECYRYIIANMEIKEYRKQCKVCGKVFCFTETDLRKNEQIQKQAQSAARNALLQSIGGTVMAASSELNRSDNLSGQVVDYSKCPNCNSSNIVDLTEEQFQEEQARVNSANNNPVSAADELLKFKELLDAGAITAEEYESKKKQILGL